MDPATISALIGGIASVVASGASAAGTAINNKTSYEYSKKFFEYQNQYNLQHFSPEENMARLQQAGINPHEVSGAPGSGLSMQGNPQTPHYQSPIGDIGNGLTQALQMAYQVYSQQQALDNQSSLIKSQVEKNTAEAARTNYQVANLLPIELEYQKNRQNIPLYQLGVMKLQQQRMLNEISLFSMQKQKFQLGLDLLELQKKYQDSYYKYRNQSVMYDALNKQNQYGISSLDLQNYRSFGLRPHDPWYTRVATNILESLFNNSDPNNPNPNGASNWFVDLFRFLFNR